MKLVITAGPRCGMSFPLLDRAVVIGRGREATIQVDDRRVSRRHAVIEPDAGSWILKDLDSVNQTYLNDEVISRAVLKAGDKIRVGNVELEFTAATASTTEPASPSVPIASALDNSAEPTAIDPPSDLASLMVMSDDVSVSMDRASLQQSLRATADKGPGLEEALYELSLRSELSEDPEEFIEGACAIVANSLKASAWAWIEWPDGAKGRLHARGMRNGVAIGSTELEMSQTLIRRVLDEQAGLMSSEISCDFNQSLAVLHNQITSAIAVPLCDDKTSIVFYLDRTIGMQSFERRELEHLAILGSKLSVQLANLKLYQKLEKAYRDLHCSQSELVKSEKLAAIGRLSGGFAHDLNNPLGSIICFLEMATKVMPDPAPDPIMEKVARYLNRATAAANYCRALSLNLLAFAKEKPFGSDASPAAFPIKQIIEGTVDICQSALTKSSATVSLDVEEDLQLQGDPSTLQQVIMNLVSNAADAMADDTDPDSRQIEIVARRSEDGVQITISDRGPGIPPEVAERIFEPLFTTKARDRGTGLGLFVVHRIVRDSGGSIEFAPRDGGGTTFTVALPSKLSRLGQSEEQPAEAAEAVALETPS